MPIYDLHIHLNGTTEADFVIQQIFRKHKSFIYEISSTARDKEVMEQYLLVIGENSLHGLYKKLARFRALHNKLRKLCEFNYLEPDNVAPNGFKLFYIMFKRLLADSLSLEQIEEFYEYMLLYHQFYKLMIQQPEQIGFDQFQKITKNNLREDSEKEYANRYKQIKTIYQHNLLCIEGRFAPKNNRAKMNELFQKILLRKQHQNFDDIPLSGLVAHFIKKLDKRKANTIRFCRDMKLRLEILRSSRILLYIIKKNPKIKNAVVGFDGAANELHARPEVFAPIFKEIRAKQLGGFTFHAGEDFIDLVSGIRYIYEAVDFLGFEHGDRIGHGTAIGISPKLWKSRNNQQLWIERGEYLDNLVFVYYLTMKSNKHANKLEEIKNRILELYNQIYCSEHDNFDINILIDAWLLRKEDPLTYFSKTETKDKAFALFKRYHQDCSVLKKSKEKIIVDIDFISNKVLIFLQNEMIKQLNSKNIAIEAMVSSNVRISFYNRYSEHHIFRWLGIAENTSKYPRPIVVLATDNPGIFVTNMKNEITHLYLCLKNDYLLNEEGIWAIITKILENNSVYTFKQSL